MWIRIFGALAILVPLLMVAFMPHLWTESAPGFILFGVSLAIWAGQSVLRAFIRRASESWPATTGTVESVEVDLDDPRESGLRSPYELRIAYSYRAGGDWYSGFDSRRFGRESEVDEASRGLRGKNVFVRYNPQRPEESVVNWVAPLDNIVRPQ